MNDVLLAAVAGGLRRYLLDRDAFIDEVNWMVPVNLKPIEENLPPDLGNFFALVFSSRCRWTNQIPGRGCFGIRRPLDGSSAPTRPS